MDEIHKIRAEAARLTALAEKLEKETVSYFHFTKKDLKAFSKLKDALYDQPHSSDKPLLAEAIDISEQLLTHLMDGNSIESWANSFIN